MQISLHYDDFFWQKNFKIPFLRCLRFSLKSSSNWDLHCLARMLTNFHECYRLSWNVEFLLNGCPKLVRTPSAICLLAPYYYVFLSANLRSLIPERSGTNTWKDKQSLKIDTEMDLHFPVNLDVATTFEKALQNLERS